jgi:hypothetical protein
LRGEGKEQEGEVDDGECVYGVEVIQTDMDDTS